MKQQIICALITMSAVSLYASPYKSTLDARKDIETTFEFVFQSENIYKRPRLLEELRKLGNNLNTYVMEKQGILYGKKLAKSEYKKELPLDNIFNLWDEYIFPVFQKLVDTIQTLRLSPNDQNARDLLDLWKKTSNWKDRIGNLEAIKADTRLDGKKKLADVIILFTQDSIKLINRALQDLRK